jgi:hypothetical protein
MRQEMALSLALAVGLWLVLLRLARRTSPARADPAAPPGAGGAGKGRGFAPALWLPFFLSLLVFGLSAQEDWFTGFWFYNPLLALAAAGLALLLTGAPWRWRRVAGAAALAVVATYSFGIGLLCWPLGALALWWQRETDRRYLTRALPVWLLLGAGNCLAYFYNYRALLPDPALSAGPLAAGEYVRFVFIYLGAPLWFVTPEPALWIGLIGVGLAAGLAVWVGRRRSRIYCWRYSPWEARCLRAWAGRSGAHRRRWRRATS